MGPLRGSELDQVCQLKKGRVSVSGTPDHGSSVYFGVHLPPLKTMGFNMVVGQHQWYHFGVGAPSLVYFSGWLGMFTGGTIWLLTHGHRTTIV